MGNATGPNPHYRTRLGARFNLYGLFAIDSLERQLRAERSGGHRQRHSAVQIVPFSGEHVVRPLMHLDVEITGRATTGADLALPGEANAHTVLDPGRYLHRQVTTLPHAPLPRTVWARVGDNRAEAL